MSTSITDQYLDRLFDLLAGTGARGRRALIEAEAHLCESTESLRNQGYPADEAAREAIDRFGTAPEFARAVRREGAISNWVLCRRIGASAWLMLSIALASSSIWGVLNWLMGSRLGPEVVAPDAPSQTYSAARCADLLAAYPQAVTCQAASVSHHFAELVYRPLSAGVVGVMSLALFVLARRSDRFRDMTVLPPTGMVTVAGVALFGGAAAILMLTALDRLQIGQTWGIGADFAQAVAALTAAATFLPGAWRELRYGPAT